jgi:Holliday junction resolvase RusA-like endonuclease
VTFAPDSLDVRFWVPGKPVPKGNHNAFPIARGRCACSAKPGKKCRIRNCFGGVLVGTTITDAGGPELEAWQEMVRVMAISARNAAGQRVVPRGTAVSVSLVFVEERPDGHWSEAGLLTKAGRDRQFPSVAPDWDKLSRAVCDGLMPALVEDDSQFVLAGVGLVYAPWKSKPGVIVRARRVSSLESWVARELDFMGIDTRSPQESLL